MNGPSRSLPVQAQQFLDRLEPSGAFGFAVLPEAKSCAVAPSRHYGKVDEFKDHLTSANAAGAGIFVTVNQLDGNGHRRENVNRVRAAFVDLDGAPLEPVTAWKLSPHMVIESSPGRWHAYWLVADLPLDQFATIQKALAQLFDGDPKVCDLPRVMRLPGFAHCKGSPHLVTIERIDEHLGPYPASGLIEALGLVPLTRKVAALAERAGLISEGQRNATLASVAGRMRRRGADQDTIHEALSNTNTSRCDPPLSDSEVENIAASIARYAPASCHIPDEALTDTGNARLFVDQHGADLRYLKERQIWLAWNGTHWEEDSLGSVTERAKASARSMLGIAATIGQHSTRQAVISHAQRSLNRASLTSMMSLASTDPCVAIRHTDLDSDDYLFGVRNGVVDLRTGVFRVSQREDLITQAAGVSYDKDASCPNFLAFLARVTGGDADQQGYLKRLAGYMLTGSTREQCFAFFYGSGANGKSTFINVLSDLLGSYATQAQPETFMARKGDGARNDIARLAGKRLVVSNEIAEGSHLDENLLKQLVGGDIVTARFLYREHFEFRPRFKLLIAGNHKPVVKGRDDGIWRRIHLVPFEQTIPEPERDKNLGAKLRAELPGILNWAIEGCLEWQRSGLQPTAIVTQATKAYRGSMDLVGDWLDEKCELDVSFQSDSPALYASYKFWCDRSGIKPASRPSFYTMLEDRGHRRKRLRTGPVFEGIRLRHPASAVA